MTSPLPPSADPILDPLARNRVAVGTLFAVMALIFLAGSGYCFVKAYTDAPVVEKADEAKPALKDDTALVEAKLSRLYSNEYTLGGIVGLLAALTAGAAGGWLIGRLPVPDSAEDRRTNRLLLFFVGAALGLVFMILGFVLFYLWFGELTKWLGQAEKSEPLKPLLAVLAFLLGAGLLFAGVQPLRAEERHDSLLRRIVYGSNFFLTTLLLIVGLVFVNVLATLKLPSKLDTTETGFYSLSTTTKDYVALLDQDVVIYTTIQETNDGGSDALRVLNAFQEANPKRVKLKQLSLTLDKKELTALKTKFPAADFVDAEGRISRLGLVIAIGPDEKRYQFIQQMELFGKDGNPQQGPVKRTFQAEPRIIREILFLTESKLKPVIYFTQGSGEISIEAAGLNDINGRSGEQIKQALIDDYCEVKSLKFDAFDVNPKVPVDATAVIVADPTAKLSDVTLLALRNYMTNQKGKLLVLAGAHRDPTNPKTILNIGLEKILAEYDIELRDRVVYSEPIERLSASEIIAVCPPSLIAAKNTIAMTFAREALIFRDTRPLNVGDKSQKAKALFVTGVDRYMWLESEFFSNPQESYTAVRALSDAGRGGLLASKELNKSPRIFAAVASEPDKASKREDEPDRTVNRVVVFGLGSFQDVDKSADGRAIQAELVTASVNWLRDRPAVANEGAKPYGVYTASAKWDWTRGVTLPVLLVILSITTVGLGLWVLRRR